MYMGHLLFIMNQASSIILLQIIESKRQMIKIVLNYLIEIMSFDSPLPPNVNVIEGYKYMKSSRS